MKPKPTLILILFIVVILAFPTVVVSSPYVLIEFLYYEVCSSCPGFEIYYEAYLHNSRVVDHIQRDYGSNVLIERIDWKSTEGREKRELYNLSVLDWNTIVVNSEVILKGGEQFVDETYLREIIDSYLALEHDVAILDVTPASRSITKGEILNVNITAMNKGKQSESFNITVSLNSTSIGILSVDFLEPNMTITLPFYLNTTQLLKGYHVLSAYIPPVQNEINIDDNSYYAGIVEVKAQGANSTFIRDVTVLSVIPSKSHVTNQEQVNITVTVKNLGTETENFTLEMLLNGSLIAESDNIILNPDSYASKVFVVSTVNLNIGDCLIKAYIEPVEGEFNSTNNEGSCTISVSEASLEDNGLDFMVNISLAFIFGFFESFSPCLVVLLSFVLSYTIGEATGFKEGFSYVMAFGLGFISAALLISLIASLIFFSVSFQNTLIWIVCIFTIFFGLNTMGFDITRIFKIKNETKSLVQKLAKKYARTYMGIIILGFLFYFLDPCIAPFFFAVIPLVMNVDFTLIVIAFCLGVMLPFVCIGIITGSISKLARNMYKHKSKIRIISGLILICYSIYLIVFHLIY